MNCLRDLLSRVSPDRVLWSVGGHDAITAADLRSFLEATGDLQASLRGRSVAVFSRNSFDFARLLLALDGVCQRITLLPAIDSTQILLDIVQESGCDVVVTSGGDQIAKTLSKNVVELDHSGWVESSSRAKPNEPKPNEPKPNEPAPDEPLPTEWVLPTSGTTGRPKLVPHTFASLTRSSVANPDRGDEFVWGSLYGLSSFAGLQVFLQSWLGGSRLILGSSDASLPQRLGELIDGGCNSLSATPTMWRMLMMLPRAGELPLKQITLGGETVDQGVLEALRASFPEARITQIYASTEAGVGFAVRDERAGFPVSYLDQPPSGVEVHVDDVGRLLLRHGRQPWIDTGDVVCRVEDRFLFQGRSSGMINVGGRKVDPQEVEAILLQSPEVALARVSARRNPITGSIVQAEVVVRVPSNEQDGPLQDKLIGLCRRHLEPYKVPAIVRVVDSIELTPSGKVKR